VGALQLQQQEKARVSRGQGRAHLVFNGIH
jgi:hypothetical protein